MIVPIIRYIIRNWVRITLNGIFALIAYFALLMLFSAQLNQGLLAIFYARMVIILSLYMMINPFVRIGFGKR